MYTYLNILYSVNKELNWIESSTSTVSKQYSLSTTLFNPIEDTGGSHLHSRSLFLDAYDDSEFGVFLCLQHSQSRHREEKSFRHIAKVAKFLDGNKPKTSLKKWIRTASNFIDLIQFHLIWQMLAKFSRVESERTVSKFRRGKRQLLCCVHLLHKASVWN